MSLKKFTDGHLAAAVEMFDAINFFGWKANTLSCIQQNTV